MRKNFSSPNKKFNFLIFYFYGCHVFWKLVQTLKLMAFYCRSKLHFLNNKNHVLQSWSIRILEMLRAKVARLRKIFTTK